MRVCVLGSVCASVRTGKCICESAYWEVVFCEYKGGYLMSTVLGYSKYVNKCHACWPDHHWSMRHYDTRPV
jgi:hypothetical protein